MAADRTFWVIWNDDRSQLLSADDIAKFSLDAESWANFLWLLLRRRKFAVMKAHRVSTKAVEGVFKVVWQTDGAIPKYASLV